MDIIPVTPEISVELDSTRWRLVQDYDNGKSLRTLVDADASSIKFHPVLAETYQLSSVDVENTRIVKVVLGWTPQDQHWHLGLYVNGGSGGELSWCRLTTWTSEQMAQAKSAGEALSQIINSPFHLVDANINNDEEASSLMEDATQPSMQTSPQKIHPVSMPIQVGDWMLRAVPQGIAWQLTGSWMMRQVVHILFFAGTFALFLVLGAGALRSGLAPVTPEWLPLIAFAIALVLVYSMFDNIWQLIMKRQVIVDKLNREVRCERVLSGIVDWRVDFDSIEYLLISQEPARPLGRKSRDAPMQIAQDSWIHLYAKDNFFLLSEIEDVEGKSWHWETVRRRSSADERMALDLTEYDTPLHHAVMELANSIGIKAYVDIR